MKITNACITLAAVACAAQRLEPALFSPQFASDQSIVSGVVLSIVPDSLGVQTLIRDKTGWNHRVLVLRLQRTGMTMEGGDEVTAWCRGVGENLVADSVRVDKHFVPRKSQEVPPYVPATPP